MGRPLRVDGIGVWHNVGHRAAAGRRAFRDQRDKVTMWRLFQRLEEKFGIEVHALTLLDTHLHAVLRSRDGRLSEAAQWLFSVYTKAFNRRHGIDGALFRGRFWSEPVANESTLRHVIRYTHENALDVGGIDDPVAYRWSTCRLHASGSRKEPWVHRDGVAFALRRDSALARDTAKRRSPRLGSRPPRVPAAAIERAIQRYAACSEPFVSHDFRTGLFRARSPD